MSKVFKPGDVFRGYTIEKLLGEGGIGSVWLARHGMLDTLFAVKILDREIAKAKPEYVKRFVREAKLATKIRHPNLVVVHDAGYDESLDVYYLIMDYIRGDTLRLAIAMGGPRPEAEAAGIVMQIADVLDTSQRFGLVHRDLKPENIMVSPGGAVRLLDLGVAKANSSVDSLRTMAASVFGTPSYISPEQAMDSSTVDVRADIYSLGIILFEMLAGRRPYDGDTPTEILMQLLSEAPVPDVRDFAPSVSPALANVVAKMCAKRPEDRFTTPADLIAALEAAGFRRDALAARAGGVVSDEREQPSMDELLASVPQHGVTGDKTLLDITLTTRDPDINEFLARRRRSRIIRVVVKAAAVAATAIAVALVALKACGETVRLSDCERDPSLDEWAEADVAFAREVTKDVLERAGLEAEEVPFGGDSMFDRSGTDVLRCAFQTPELSRDFDFPMQPLATMHFALYSSPERAREMMNVRITDWPRLRVGYSPVSQGKCDDRQQYFEHASLSPEYVEFKRSADAVDALRKGTIDLLFLYTSEGRRPEKLVEIVPIGSRSVYFAVKKGKGDILDKMQAAYRECYIDNVEKYDSLREQLLGIPKPKNRVRVAAYIRGRLFDISESGGRSGVIEEWLAAVAGQAHWNLDYVYGNYEESMRDVMSGRLDIIGGVGFSSSRSERVLYSHTPIGMLRVYLWTKPGNRFKAGDQTTWKGMRMGLLAGAFSTERVKRQLEENGNSAGIECVEFRTDREMLKAYFDGEIDACVDIETPALDHERALHAYVSHPMYLCVTPSRRKLFLELEQALDGVCDDFSKYMRMIAERHYGIRSEMSVLTFEEAEWLKNRAKDFEPVMIDFSPWPVNLRDDKGNIVHFAKEFLAELSRRTGLVFDAQPQTGLMTAEAKFRRGQTKFWIPYPEDVDIPAMGGRPVFSIPVPKTYAHMIGAETGNDDMEMWANAGVPDELVSIIRKAVSSIDSQDIQEMFIKAATERKAAKRIFGMTDEEFERALLIAGLALVSLVAVFAVVMSLLLMRQVRRANEAAAVAQEYSRAKTRFLAMMSHELRTPLNAVIGFSEFLARPDCDECRRKKYLAGIQLSSNALLDLINDILDLSKLDSGSMQMLSGECDMDQAAEEIRAIFSYNLRRNGVPFNVRRSSAAPVPVLRISHQGVKQMLINLVGNSAKFTSDGEITLEYGWDAETRTLTLTVRDTGCGISSEKMAHLFDPFVQDISSRMKHADGKMRGTGLGLPIVKRMVDNAGGTVDVTSEVGKGTTFVVKIPSLDIVRPAPPRRATHSHGMPEKILVVDDMETNREILEIHLKNIDVKEVRCAENGVAALKTMESWIPDAVLTDIWMPEMDGHKLAVAMRSDPRLDGIPVMAITADVDVASTYDMSVFAKVVSKPVTSEKLRNLFADTAAH